MNSRPSQVFKINTEQNIWNLRLYLVEPEPGDDRRFIKLEGEIPWLEKGHRYFPDELVGLMAFDEQERGYQVVRAEYDLDGDQRYVKYLWLTPLKH